MPIDPCGLAIGVVGLASLFKTCVECFEYVDAGRNYGRDYEILLTKLEVEKTRFLIWGESVGILELQNHGRDPQIDRPWVIPIVEKILGSIQVIFHDAQKIGSRYGLQPLPFAPAEGRTPARLSANLMNRCRESYMKFLLRAGRSQQETSATAKFRWAICDRSKFQVMISDLRELIDGLMDITPSVHHKEQKVVKEEIDSLSDIASLRLLQEACADSYQKWSETASMRIGSSSVTRDLEEEYVVEPHLNIDNVVQHYSENEWYEQRIKQLQEEIVALRAHIELIETFPVSNIPDGDSFQISHNTVQLGNLVNRWAANIIRTRPTSLNAICNAASVDAGIRLGLIPKDIPPMHAQSLLRNVMFEAISDRIINILSVTDCPKANNELTRIHAKLFNANPTAASFWLSCTLSTAAKDLTFSTRNTLKDLLPTLASILPSTDGTAILESAGSFSRKLWSLSATSNTLYHSFIPGLDSRLDFRSLKLAKRCLRTDGGKTCRVGATICMGLAKVTRRPAPQEGGMEDCTMVVRKAQVICDCALAVAPQTTLLSNYTKHDVDHPLLSICLPKSSKLSETCSKNLVIPPAPLSVLPPISLPLLCSLGPARRSPSPLAGPSRQVLPQSSQSESSTCQSNSKLSMVYLRSNQTKCSTPFDSEHEEELSMATLASMVVRQMKEISALRAQMRKWQPLFENAIAGTSVDAGAVLPSSTIETPPPY